MTQPAFYDPNSVPGASPVGGQKVGGDASQGNLSTDANQYNSGQDEWSGKTSLGGRPTLYDANGNVVQVGTADAMSQQFQRDANTLQAPGYNDLHNDQTLAGGARNDETDALALERDAALGNAPSAAQILNQQSTQQAENAAMSMAGSVKGGAGARVAAMRNAQTVMAQTAAAGNVQNAALRANEMANARTAFTSAAQGVRGGDISQEGVDLNQVGAEQQNEQYYNGLSLRPLEDNQQATEQQSGEVSGQYQQQRTIANANSGGGPWNKAGVVGSIWAGGASAAAKGMGQAAQQSGGQSDESSGGGGDGSGTDDGTAAKGGPVAGGRPYLVGERGPELVIPKRDATVIPANVTASLLGTPIPRAAGGPMYYPREDGGPVQAGGEPAKSRPAELQTLGRSARVVAPRVNPQAQRDAVARAEAVRAANGRLGLAGAGLIAAGAPVIGPVIGVPTVAGALVPAGPSPSPQPATPPAPVPQAPTTAPSPKQSPASRIAARVQQAAAGPTPPVRMAIHAPQPAPVGPAPVPRLIPRDAATVAAPLVTTSPTKKAPPPPVLYDQNGMVVGS